MRWADFFISPPVRKVGQYEASKEAHVRSLGVLFVAIAAFASAQQEWTPGAHQDGGVSQVLQSISLKNA